MASNSNDQLSFCQSFTDCIKQRWRTLGYLMGLLIGGLGGFLLGFEVSILAGIILVIVALCLIGCIACAGLRHSRKPSRTKPDSVQMVGIRNTTAATTTDELGVANTELANLRP